MKRAGNQSDKIDQRLFKEQQALLFMGEYSINEQYFEAPTDDDRCTLRRLKNLQFPMKKHKSTQEITQSKNTEKFVQDKSQEPHRELTKDDQRQTREEEQRKEPKRIGLNDFQILKVLGYGGYGKVYLVQKKDNMKLFAMKVIKKERLSTEKQQIRTKTEKEIYQVVDHPFIMKLRYSFKTSDKLYMVLKFCPGGELLQLIQKKGKLTEEETRFFAACVFLSIQKIHRSKVIYRDLKPENVIIDKDGYPIITDFGLSIMNQYRTQSFVGTQEYMAPEVLQKYVYTSAIDWWSYGVLIYEMMAGMPPFQSEKKEIIKRNIISNLLSLKKTIDFEPYIPTNWSREAQDLVSRLLCKNPKMRLGCSFRGDLEIMQHPFFKNLDWNKLLKKEVNPPFVPEKSAIENLEYFNEEFIRMSITSKQNKMNDEIPRSEMENNNDDDDIWQGFSYQGSVISNQNYL